MEIGGPELMVVLAVVALLFGPGRITGLARALGESIHDFRAAQRAAEADDRPDRPDPR
ncbi:MAG TPA: twin-arginine translocase TatA/TatE family subunit [Acidimicrobiales bacterium]|nr:twin-arginine translocase TatA/TatE family subunit [Acidimicrobiales bacterium]